MNSCQKGKRGEREWRDELRAQGFLKARRGQQFSGGSESPDVACPELAGIHFEVKRVEALNILDAMLQAIRDAGPHKTPVLAHKKNRGEWLVTMRASDWFKIVREFLALPAPQLATGLLTIPEVETRLIEAGRVMEV